MNPYKARKLAKVIAVVLALAMIITSFSMIFAVPSLLGRVNPVVYAAERAAGIDLQMTQLKQYIQYIQQNYKDDITTQELINGAFKGVADALGDPYSVFYETTEESNQFLQSVEGEFSGIGVELEDYEGKCRVVSPIPGTPADKAGIKSGDVVVAVDKVDVTGKTVNDAISLMRGNPGTQVMVTVERAGQTYDFTMVREKIKSTSVYPKMLADKIGYIQITNFDSDSDEEFAEALEGLMKQDAKALIIDLRNNPGGIVGTALGIANQLIDEGPLVHFAQQGKVLETITSDGKATFDKPIILLINEGSASASEILAGALKDSGKAVLVGTTSFGKGVSQQVMKFSNGTSLKLSMYYFTTPNGDRIDHIGVIPQHTVKMGKDVDRDELVKLFNDLAPMIEEKKAVAGDVGLNVYGAQQRLELLGYGVTASGVMDEKTTEAVKRFQKEQELHPYGVLDLTTMKLLNLAVVNYLSGVDAKSDLQLEKAIELLK